MKLTIEAPIVALLIATANLRSVAGELAFTGVFSTQTSTLVAIAENSDAPRWVRVGERVGSYVVKSFDPKRETVALQNDDGVIELKLKDSKVRPAPTMELFESLARQGDGKFPYLLKAYQESEKMIAKSKAYLADYEKGTADEEKLMNVARLRESIDKLEHVTVKLWEQMIERAAEVRTPPSQPTEPAANAKAHP